MNRYFIRSVKYLIWLTVLFLILFTLMLSTGTSRVGAEEGLAELWGSSRGLLMIFVIIVLAILYPRFGFVTRTFEVNPQTAHNDIIKTFDMSGFKLENEDNGTMTFRAASTFKRAMLLWEDTIIVNHSADIVIIEGIRKEVVKIEFRLKSFAQ